MRRLISRKFLATIGTLAVLLANRQYTEATALVLGYCGINVYQKAQAPAPFDPLGAEDVGALDVEPQDKPPCQ